MKVSNSGEIAQIYYEGSAAAHVGAAYTDLSGRTCIKIFLEFDT